MTIVKTLTTAEMVDDLLADGYASWTYKSATALVEWLEEMWSGDGEPLEWDPVAIRCEFSVYPDEATAKHDYSIEDWEELSDYTHVIHYDGGIIIQDF